MQSFQPLLLRFVELSHLYAALIELRILECASLGLHVHLPQELKEDGFEEREPLILLTVLGHGDAYLTLTHTSTGE